MRHLIGLMLGALAMTAAASPARPQTFDAQARALDGDTVSVDFRLLGVDAFERRQLCQKVAGCWQCGKAAQDFAANALRSKRATIQLTSSSSYGRPVAIVTVDGQDLGERMIRAGLAVPETQYLRGDTARAAVSVGIRPGQSPQGRSLCRNMARAVPLAAWRTAALRALTVQSISAGSAHQDGPCSKLASNLTIGPSGTSAT